MSLYRSYFSKQATLLEGNLTCNAALNQVSEIVRGRSVYSRFLFEVDLSGLLERHVRGDMGVRGRKHTITLHSTIRFRPELVGNDYLGFQRDYGFDLHLHPVGEDFATGTDCEYNYGVPGLGFMEQRRTVPEYPNWVMRSETRPWAQPGAWTGGTPTATCHIPTGAEDAVFDVTADVERALSAGNDRLRLLLKYAPAFESSRSEHHRSYAFHSPKTDTFYEPHLASTWVGTVADDRHSFFLSKTNKLYLLLEHGLEQAILDTPPGPVEIHDQDGNLFMDIPASGITREGRGAYSVSFGIPAWNGTDGYPDQVLFTDTWKGIAIGGYRVPDITQAFLLRSPVEGWLQTGGGAHNPASNVHLTAHGILAGESIRRGEVRHLHITARTLYRTHTPLALPVFCRLYVTQGTRQMDVIPATPADRIGTGYRFTIDTGMLPAHDYTLEIGLAGTAAQTLGFRVADGFVR